MFLPVHGGGGELYIPRQTPRGSLGQTYYPRQTPPKQMAIAADGMHPTGMHSCMYGSSVILIQASKLKINLSGSKIYWSRSSG